jgi:hypothetical protein
MNTESYFRVIGDEYMEQLHELEGKTAMFLQHSAWPHYIHTVRPHEILKIVREEEEGGRKMSF